MRFQETARLLLKMEKGGLVHRCHTVESEIAGERYFDYMEYALPTVGQSPNNPSYVGIIRHALIPHNKDRIHIPRGLTPQGEALLKSSGLTQG